jgi:hypothetical protein
MIKAEIKLTLDNGAELVCCVADVEAQLFLKQDQGDRFEEYRPGDGTMTATLHGQLAPKPTPTEGQVVYVVTSAAFADPTDCRVEGVFSSEDAARAQCVELPSSRVDRCVTTKHIDRTNLHAE